MSVQTSKARPSRRAYWVTDGEVCGGFISEDTGRFVVVYPDRHDPEAVRLVVAKEDLV